MIDYNPIEDIEFLEGNLADMSDYPEMQEAVQRLKEYFKKEEELDKLTRSAMDKANPEKVTYVADGYDTDGNLIYDMADCPNCGREFEYAVDDSDCNYCCDCGQALDWGDDQ